MSAEFINHIGAPVNLTTSKTLCGHFLPRDEPLHDGPFCHDCSVACINVMDKALARNADLENYIEFILDNLPDRPESLVPKSFLDGLEMPADM